MFDENSEGLYVTSVKKCIPFPTGGPCPADQCYQIDLYSYSSMTCMNCTALTPTNAPINKTENIETSEENEEEYSEPKYRVDLPALREGIKIN
ncbi:hypothetical protein PPL_09711 [Heterostelium album PN500]|uniref:Uncharacterized protein n=1 Tax=Heterostelium pallidum (strain ATCC 26659 / Pp 5 / PN500) TaxID=670386 RepID=D3BNK8_HETP5|nr:hypothetical protein PPL_09711 [Heterostelium album PN500]EFA76959.1 hypothetical protein PPL_09711 [Heterostelium album PN500]|eukprot:XP_020429090.1 hypothetical protein PPL_09711 [Heterostelium album PN500]